MSTTITQRVSALHARAHLAHRLAALLLVAACRLRLVAPCQTARQTHTPARPTAVSRIIQYEQDVEELIGHLAYDSMDLAEKIAALREEIRGYGHVKMRNIEKAARQRDALLAGWRRHTPGSARLGRAA